MCVVSNVLDYERRRWDEWIQPNTIPPYTSPPNTDRITITSPADTRKIEKDISDLRREVAELRKLLEAAAEFDRKTGQADCESTEKIEALRSIAKLLGVDIEPALEVLAVTDED